MTAADAPNWFEDSSRPLAENNETQQLTRAILEQAETMKKILALLEERLPRAANPNSPDRPRRKAADPRLSGKQCSC